MSLGAKNQPFGLFLRGLSVVWQDGKDQEPGVRVGLW